VKLVFLEIFGDDLKKISDTKVKRSIKKAILKIESALSLGDVSGWKKLKGEKSAYRLRVGVYRIGFYLEKDTVIFARILHRKDIYRLFP
jgi:mRNA interferase RelE/StbE